MHYLVRLLPRVLFLALGASIALISLLSANRVFSQGENLALTSKKLYFQEEILPNHLLYPVYMVIDKVKLELAQPAEVIDLQILYAWRRLEYTEQLLPEGYQSLSFSTLTKAFKYYNAGLTASQAATLRPDQRTFLVQDAIHFRERAAKLESHFTDTQQQELIRLKLDQTALIQALIDSI